MTNFSDRRHRLALTRSDGTIVRQNAYALEAEPGDPNRAALAGFVTYLRALSISPTEPYHPGGYEVLAQPFPTQASIDVRDWPAPEVNLASLSRCTEVSPEQLGPIPAETTAGTAFWSDDQTYHLVVAPIFPDGSSLCP